MRLGVDRLQQLRGLVTVDIAGDVGVPLATAASAGRTEELRSAKKPATK